MKPGSAPLDPEVQKAFLEYDKERRIRLTQVGCLIVVVLTVVGIPVDAIHYHDQSWSFLWERLLVTSLAAAIWFLLGHPSTKRHYLLWGLVLPLLPAFGNAWNIATTDGAASPYYAVFILVLVPTALLLPWTFQENLTVSVLTIAMYLGACWTHGDSFASGDFQLHLFFLITVAGICVIGTYYASQLRIREFTARWELDASHRKLVELDQAKGRFFANISHELRTPLTLLIAPLETLREDPGATLGEGGGDLLDTMEQNALRLLKLINDLLDLVRLEEGRLPVKWESADLSEFLTGLCTTLSHAATERKLDLRSRVPYDLGARWVDKDKLERILLNLLFNAIKFTPAGGRVALSARLEGERVLLEVEDTGIGISEGDLPHVFDRFWQADASTRRRYGGTGIGLALVRELAEAQGGSVTVKSREGAGSTFTVDLPAYASIPQGAFVESDAPAPPEPSGWLGRLYRRAELSPALTAPPGLPALPQAPAAGLPSGSPRILVVDDEPDIRKYLRGQLSNRFEILEAVDGSQGLEMARQYQPDLLLLDLMLPGKDGFQVLAELREDERTRTLPVVLLTARADEDTKIRALSNGADDFLTKPFSVTELHLRVQNLVNARELSKTLARQNTILNATLERLKETEMLLVQSEKMNALGQLSAGLIHEINNPLNYALSAVHMLERNVLSLPEGERESYKDQLSDVKDGLMRVSRLITDLKGFSHRHSGSLESTALRPCVDTALRFFAHRLSGVEVDVDLEEGLQVVGNANQLVQVLVNLLQNALDAGRPAAEAGGRVLKVSLRGHASDGRVLLEVEDDGPGIPPEIQSKVFDPFFTTKDVGQGVGLGLSICHQLMEGMGGRILLTSAEGRGARFTLDWPAPETAGIPEAKHASAL